MLIRKPDDIKSSEITDKKLYVNRRKFLALGAATAGAAVVAGAGLRLGNPPETTEAATGKLPPFGKSALSTDEKQTPFKDITNYNNYYEFSTDKYEPAGLSKNFRTRPWTVTVDGLAGKSKVLDVDSIITSNPLEERIYRHRCVEGWSMVIPWVGFPLGNFIKQLDPQS